MRFSLSSKVLACLLGTVCLIAAAPPDSRCQGRGSINGYYVDQMAASTANTLYDNGYLTDKEYGKLMKLAKPLPSDPLDAGPEIIDFYSCLGDIFIEKGIASSGEIETIKYRAASAWGYKIAGANPLIYGFLFLEHLVDEKMLPVAHAQHILDSSRVGWVNGQEGVTEIADNILSGIDDPGDLLNPQMNPQYLAMKKRELERALEEYQDARKRYAETPFYLFFTKPSRRRGMERALDEYLDRIEDFSQTKIDFNYDVYVNTNGLLSLLKPVRKQKWRDSVMDHGNFILTRADCKLRQARQEYRDESWFFFWSKLKKKEAYLKARRDFEIAVVTVDNFWRKAGIITGASQKSLDTGTGVTRQKDSLKIGIEIKDDM